MLLGMVALGTMQALKPLNRVQEGKTVAVSFDIDAANFLTPVEEGLLIELNVNYYDSMSDNVKTFDVNELSTSSFTFVLLGEEYIHLTEINFYGATYDISYTPRSSQDLTTGYYNIWNRHTGGNYFDLEDKQETKTPIREDTEMYTLLQNTGEQYITGWYAIDKKYTYEYSDNEIVTFSARNTEIMNSVFYWLTNDTGVGYQGWQLYDNRDIELLDKELTMSYGAEFTTLGYYYIGNCKYTQTLWNHYNVYRINYPERLNKWIVNKTYYLDTFNPYGGTGYEFGSGSIVIKAAYVDGGFNDLDTYVEILEGLALIDTQYTFRATSYYRNPNNMYEIDRSGNIHSLSVANHELEYTAWVGTSYTNLNDTATIRFVEPEYKNVVDNNEIKPCYTGGIKKYAKTIYIAFNQNEETPTLQECLASNYNYEGSNEVSNIFTLIEHGFRSLQVLLDFKVGWLPVGQLMFAPLVVGFVIWLIHLVKRG